MDEHSVRELLAHYPTLSSDKEKSLLREIFRFNDRHLIEDSVMTQLENIPPDQSGEWIQILSSVGVEQSQNQQIMLDHLHKLDNPVDLQSAISSLVAHSPDGLPGKEVIAQIESFMHHPDERVRIASIHEIGKWAGPDEAYYVEQALVDTSASIREAAILSLSASGIQSDLIKESLMATMNDHTSDWNLRQSAFRALSEFPLHGPERDEHMRFQDYSKNPPEYGGEG
jgi:hypothetical protein